MKLQSLDMRNTYNTKIHFNYTIELKGSNLFPMPAIPSFPPNWNALTFILWLSIFSPSMHLSSMERNVDGGYRPTL